MIKVALLHTINLIDDYQSHHPALYIDVERELNDLKEQMALVMNQLDEIEVDQSNTRHNY